MPVFKIDIEKRYGAEYWTNSYHCEAADLVTAHGIANEVYEAEKNVHTVGVQFTKRRTSDLIPGTDNYITTVLNAFGEVALDTAMLPLFNVARVDGSVGIGRPCRKYLRGVLKESNINFDAIETATLAFLDLNYAQVLEGITELCDPDGDPVVDWQTNPYVGMRQLKRGSTRQQPILP